jgi:hypothetical protein
VEFEREQIGSRGVETALERKRKGRPGEEEEGEAVH